MSRPERPPVTRGGDEPCLVVFARAPVAGQVKTRLCAARPVARAALATEQAAAEPVARAALATEQAAAEPVARAALTAEQTAAGLGARAEQTAEQTVAGLGARAEQTAAGLGARAALTAEQAAAVHAAFVADVCRTGARSGIRRRRLYVAGDVAHPQLVRIAGEHGFRIRAQAGADLGARMAAAIADELADGASAVVLVGTDSPTLPCAYLQRAAAWLGGDADVVLGPAADGGYYLVGARLPIPELFAAGVSWGTPQVLPATLLRLRELAAAGTRVALLPFFYDVDTPQDLWLLACHLRLAAASPQAPGAASDAAPAAGGTFAADLAAMDALTGMHAPATFTALAALGWLEPLGPATGFVGE